MSSHDLINHDDHLRSLAMAVARNRAGPEDPIEDVLARESIAPSDFDSYLNDKVFKKYVTAYTHELRENGFSFASKCRILAEDAIQHMYLMTKDNEVPAAARVKAVENLVTWSGLAAKSIADTAAGTGFHITFNIPNVPNAPAARVSLTADAPTGFSMAFNAAPPAPKEDTLDLVTEVSANDITAVYGGIHTATELLSMTDVFPELNTTGDATDDADHDPDAYTQ